MVEVVNFPKTDDGKDIQEFLDEVKKNAGEISAKQVVVVMVDEEGRVGLSASGDYIDIMGMLTIAMKEF